ncbi:MAG: phage major capsid protein [Vicinamibacterales bacterium]
MSEVVTRLRERRANVWEQAKVIADRSADENRAMTAEENKAFDTASAELDALDTRIKSILEGEQRAKDTEDSFQKLTGKPVEGRGKSDDPDELREFMAGKRGHAYEIIPDKPTDFRTLSKLTAAAGLNTVPTTFYDKIVAHLIEVAAIMQAGPTVLQTGGGESIQVPKTTAHSSAAIVTEGAAIAASDPAFGQITLGAFKYGLLIQVSRELITDTGADLEGYLSMQAGRALGNAFGAHCITGTGTGQPRGVITDATLGVTSATGTAGAPTADNLIDLYYSVLPPYRNSSAARWIIRDSTIAALRKLKDTTNQYLWQPGLVGNATDTFLGKPVLVDPGVPATALNAKSVIFGDMSQYFVRMVNGIRFERSDDYAFNTDLVTFRALMRADGALVDLTGAVKYLVGAAT